MILKELDSFSSTNILERAGRQAEEQMAFYLRRAFQDEPDTFVFNDLRLEWAQDAAQMDHLVLHRGGLVIVESKSVSTQVSVNDRGEWARLFGGRWQGMPSPILQAERQGSFLRAYLDQHAPVLLDKLLGRQGYFGATPIDAVVGISDSGIIAPPADHVPPTVCKADQAPDRVRRLMQRQCQSASVFSFSKMGRSFGAEEIKRVSGFLLRQHRPCAGGRNRPAPLPVPLPTHRFTCRHCKSGDVAIAYGRYGYYFKCGSCSGNTNLQPVCPGCGGGAKIHKSRERFFVECPQCKTNQLFFTNPRVADSDRQRRFA